MARAARGQAAGKRRNPIIAFLASCWAELKKVQWPDRDTLVQASAVTLIFVALLVLWAGGGAPSAATRRGDPSV